VDVHAPLLDDIDIVDFLVHGFRLLHLDLPTGLNETIANKLDAMSANPGDGIADDDQVPELLEVIRHPLVAANLTSLAGSDYELMPHRHWHCKEPDTPSMAWHQDGKNTRDPGLNRLLGLYYPTEITAQMGPTMIVPGTHFRNAPTDRMRAYSNIKGQVPLVVPAGTFAITHYDLWHGTAANKSAQRRHMIKFLFSRTQPNQGPTWHHDPAALAGPTDWNLRAQARSPRDQMQFANPLGVSQSDAYKERAIRQSVWDSLLGQDLARSA
jgi:ectoine hydroxylase-related dioxygenase (phytanoyl-CoA dioxygenase family)